MFCSLKKDLTQKNVQVVFRMRTGLNEIELDSSKQLQFHVRAFLLYLTPSLSQTVKFPGLKVHTYMPPNSKFEGSITNLLSIWHILIEILSRAHMNGGGGRGGEPQWFLIWHFYRLFSKWRHQPSMAVKGIIKSSWPTPSHNLQCVFADQHQPEAACPRCLLHSPEPQGTVEWSLFSDHTKSNIHVSRCLPCCLQWQGKWKAVCCLTTDKPKDCLLSDYR